MPHTDACENLARLQVEVEARSVHLLSHAVPEVHRSLGFIRALVLGESHVPVDTEDRATHGPGVGHEVRADANQARREFGDEVQERATNVRLIADLVGLKLLAIIVQAELCHELKELWAEL